MATSEIINPNFEEKITNALKADRIVHRVTFIRIRRHRGKLSIFQFQNSMMKWF